MNEHFRLHPHHNMFALFHRQDDKSLIKKMDDLKNFNIHDLFRLINKTDEEFMQWLKDKKLIWTKRYCECGKEMSQLHNKDSKWPVWRCINRKGHQLHNLEV
uniref:Zn_ribbon_recom domain-containing protein n=1 Tax=Meloidogyne hapla TaxID=6305 RepID=A0A1I8BY20_MELHA